MGVVRDYVDRWRTFKEAEQRLADATNQVHDERLAMQAAWRAVKAAKTVPGAYTFSDGLAVVVEPCVDYPDVTLVRCEP
jgi:hypothetical protein